MLIVAHRDEKRERRSRDRFSQNGIGLFSGRNFEIERINRIIYTEARALFSYNVTTDTW